MVIPMNSAVPKLRTSNLLITGADHSDRMKCATSLTMALLCRQNPACGGQCPNCLRVLSFVHPNVMIIEPSRRDQDETLKDSEYQGDIKIEQIRRIIEESYKANFEDGKAIFIITHMHQITKAAANALLKCLEENNESKVFFALAPQRASVLPTIASRLVVHTLKPSSHSPDHPPKTISDIYAITATPPEERFVLSKQFSKERLLLLPELELMQETCHHLVKAYYDERHPHHPGINPPLGLGISEALTEAMELLKRNANPGLVMENLLFHQWPYA